MPLTKNFLHHDIKALHVSRLEFIVGLVLGVSYAFIFYALLYVFREGLRLFSVSEVYDLWILSDKQVNFYNIFMAFISVLLGQSICFTYWLDRPGSIKGKISYRLSGIIHDQRLMIWYFLCWFSKLAYMFITFFGISFKNGHYVFSFYPKYNYLFILIIVVIFLQTWNTIRLTFKKKSCKWSFVTMLVIIALSFGFSRINIIDYKAFNREFGQFCTYDKYQIEIPESEVFIELQNRALITHLFLVIDKDKQKYIPKLIFRNEEVNLNEIGQFVHKNRSKLRESDKLKMKVQLHIDRKVKMDFVQKVQHELSNYGVWYIAYSVMPVDREYDKNYYRDYVFTLRLPPPTDDSVFTKLGILPPPPPPKLTISELREKTNNNIDIELLTSGEYVVNNNTIKSESLKETIKQQIKNDSKYMIYLYHNPNADFASYLRILSSSKQALTELREEEAQEKYSLSYESLARDEQREIEFKYYFRYMNVFNK